MISPNTRFLIILDFLKMCQLLPFNKRKTVITFYSYISFPLASASIRNKCTFISLLVHTSEYGYDILSKYHWKLILINFNE